MNSVAIGREKTRRLLTYAQSTGDPFPFNFPKLYTATGTLPSISLFCKCSGVDKSAESEIKIDNVYSEAIVLQYV